MTGTAFRFIVFITLRESNKILFVLITLQFFFDTKHS